jgi:hypothetical protein
MRLLPEGAAGLTRALSWALDLSLPHSLTPSLSPSLPPFLALDSPLPLSVVSWSSPAVPSPVQTLNSTP